MKEIYIVAHAQAEHHLTDQVGGWFDSGLTPLGKEQAAKVATHLRQKLIGTEPKLLSSDLLRARETAGIISEAFDCTFETTADLREISYGDAEGKPNSWLKSRWEKTPDNNRLDHRHISGGETRREFTTRVYRAMDRIIESDAERHIIVTHGFTVTFLISRWIGMPIENTGQVNFGSSSAAITHLIEDDFFKSRAVKSLSHLTHLDD